MKKIEWFAFYQDFNSDKLVFTNVIKQDLIDRVKKAIKNKCAYTEIKEEIKRELMYHYWSKCEYEVVVSNWAGKDFKTKIDIWYQLEPNLDRITEYMINELGGLNVRNTNKN